MANGQWYPPEWPDRIRALADGSSRRSCPARAATVMLLQGHRRAGPAVHMLRRRASMAFAGGAYAYPGGGVDPRDDDHHVRWAGPTRAWWAERLGVDEPDGPGDRLRGRPRDVRGGGRPARRADRRLPWSATPRARTGRRTARPWSPATLSFAEFLDRRGLVLRSRPAGRLGALDHPGVRAAALRHLVLRRRPPGGPAHPQRLHGGRPHGVDPPRGGGAPATTRASC